MNPRGDDIMENKTSVLSIHSSKSDDSCLRNKSPLQSVNLSNESEKNIENEIVVTPEKGAESYPKSTSAVTEVCSRSHSIDTIDQQKQGQTSTVTSAGVEEFQKTVQISEKEKAMGQTNIDIDPICDGIEHNCFSRIQSDYTNNSSKVTLQEKPSGIETARLNNEKHFPINLTTLNGEDDTIIKGTIEINTFIIPCNAENVKNEKSTIPVQKKRDTAHFQDTIEVLVDNQEEKQHLLSKDNSVESCAVVKNCENSPKVVVETCKKGYYDKREEAKKRLVSNTGSGFLAPSCQKMSRSFNDLSSRGIDGCRHHKQHRYQKHSKGSNKSINENHHHRHQLHLQGQQSSKTNAHSHRHNGSSSCNNSAEHSPSSSYRHHLAPDIKSFKSSKNARSASADDVRLQSDSDEYVWKDGKIQLKNGGLAHGESVRYVWKDGHVEKITTDANNEETQVEVLEPTESKTCKKINPAIVCFILIVLVAIVVILPVYFSQR